MSDNNELQEHELLVLRSLHARGFAICVFTPSEMGGATQENIDDAMAEAGWREVNFHAGEWTEIDVVSKDTEEQV